MIIRIKGFDLEMTIEEGKSTSLSILDKTVYRSVISAIIENKTDLINNDVIIEENDKIVDSKKVLCITDYFNFDFNSKSILNQLYKSIEENVFLETDLSYKINYELTLINKYLNEVVTDYDFNITYENEVKISSLLKLFDYKFDFSELSSNLDKLYAYFDLIEAFNLFHIVILVNLSSLFNDLEISEIIKYLEYKKINFLLLENTFSDIMKQNDFCYIIDEDLIEFIYSK